MKQLLGAMGLLLAGTALLVPACVDNASSLAIRGVLQPTLDTCEVTADITASQFTSGIFDVAVASGPEYSAFLLVENQLVPRGDPNRLKTETSAVELYAADVQIENTSGAVLTRSANAGGGAAQFTVPIAGFIDPSVGSTPSVSVTGVLLVDSATAIDLGTQMQATKTEMDLVVSVVLHARTLGGNEIESGKWSFPIRACYGCLVTCPPKAVDPAFGEHNCADTTEDPPANCRVGLDTVVDCRLCRENPACACTN